MNISKFSKTSGTVRIRIRIFPCGSESRRPFLMRILIINTAFKCFFKTIHTSIWYNHGWNYFFRAKTVRIGKWRWPPPKEDGTAATAEGFFEFKMRKMKEKGWSNNFKPELSRIFSWSRLRFSWILNMVEGQRPLSKVADRALLLRGGCAFTTFLLPSSRLLKIKQNKTSFGLELWVQSHPGWCRWVRGAGGTRAWRPARRFRASSGTRTSPTPSSRGGTSSMIS